MIESCGFVDKAFLQTEYYDLDATRSGTNNCSTFQEFNKIQTTRRLHLPLKF